MIPFRIELPHGKPVPVVFDSPHSGSIYPDDFDHAIDRMTLRQAEDAHIDELFAPVAAMGAPLLHALFPRAYIDPNRHEADLDIDMISDDWPGPVTPSPKTLDRGVGLIWRRIRTAGEIYDRKLSAEEVSRRIESCWRPYHSALAGLIEETRARHGVCYHINCHSMPAMGDANTEDGPVARADFVIGDRDGTTCEPGLTATISDHLLEAGYWVKINDPYKGVELVKRYSDPAQGVHSVQVEINRRLFMDEDTFAKTAGYQETEATLKALSRAIIAYAVDSR